MVRVGVIGLGTIGKEHLDIYRTIPGIQVTAVADFARNIADEVAATIGAQAFGNTTELLGAGVVDAVTLSTPDHLHHDDAVKILDAGIHLLIEKPIATTIEESENLVRVAEASGVVAMPGHTLRFANQYLTAKNLVASNAIGSVVHGHVRRNNKVSVARRVNGRTSVTFFLGIHDIDALTWIVEERVTEVQAFASKQRTPDGSQAVAVTANLRLTGGGIVALEAAWGLPDEYPTDIDARLRLIGDKGEVRIDIHDFGMSAFNKTLSYPVPAAGPVYGAPQGMLYEELNAFLRAVRGEIDVPITMREAADAVRVATTIDRAIASGRTEIVNYH